MRNTLLFLLLAWISTATLAQKYGDKAFYLIDSLPLDELGDDDRYMIDSCMQVIKNAKHDSTVINALEVLCEGMVHQDWERYQQLHYELVSKQLAALPNKEKDRTPEQQLEWKRLIPSYSGAINNLGHIAWTKGYLDEALELFKRAQKIQIENKDEYGLMVTYGNMGLIYEDKGNMQQALIYHERSLEMALKSNKKKSIATCHTNLGTYYRVQGDFVKSIEHLHQSLKMEEELGDKVGIATGFNNLGIVYQIQNDVENAFQYFEKSLKIRQEIGDYHGIAVSYSNLGNMYRSHAALLCKDAGDNAENECMKKALYYFQKSLELREQLGDIKGKSTNLNNLGVIYLDYGDPDCTGTAEECKKLGAEKALKCYYESISIQETIGDKYGLSVSYSNLARLLLQLGNKKEALAQALKSLELSRELRSPERVISASLTVRNIARELGRFDLALEMYELHVQTKDSINNEETQRATIRQQESYEYEKQKAIDDKENEKKLALEKEKQKRQFVIMIITIVAASLIAVLLLIIYRRLQLTKKQKIIILEQKEEVETQRDQIEEQRDEIMASINYAKRIQDAILPSLTDIQQAVPESFVLYQPKDVVAGDFYWMETTSESPLRANAKQSLWRNDGKVYIAAADCTGHGVPGAMVSVVCSTALTKAVLEDGITDVGHILDRTREIVIDKLAKSGDVKDGMDISLACIDLKNNTLQWAGANNPLYLLRHGQEAQAPYIEIIKGNKQPIGLTENASPFTTHRFDLHPGDIIYLFTDGYADQFGGSDGKKLGYQKFRDKLVEISSLPMASQHEQLTAYLDEWQGNENQVDDICILGVKI